LTHDLNQGELENMAVAGIHHASIKHGIEQP